MEKTEHRFTKTGISLSLPELEDGARGWLLDGEIRQHSRTTLANRRIVLDKLLWFLRQKGLTSCGTRELRLFLAHLTNGHEAPGGRWGGASEEGRNPQQARQQTRPVGLRTVQTYHCHLRTFFRWLVADGLIEASPLDNIAPPIARADQIQPFTPEQIQRLLAAAKRSPHPRREEAIILFLLDTGVGCSELCGLRMKDIDFQGRRATVLGKGNKTRSIYFSGPTTKALWQYLRGMERRPHDALFLSDRGTRAGEPLTRSGLFQMEVLAATLDPGLPPGKPRSPLIGAQTVRLGWTYPPASACTQQGMAARPRVVRYISDLLVAASPTSLFDVTALQLLCFLE